MRSVMSYRAKSGINSMKFELLAYIIIIIIIMDAFI